MDDYNFWSDLFDTWQSTADWIKALAILTPPASTLAALALRHRQARSRADAVLGGTLAYTIWRDEGGRLQVVRHEAQLSRALIPLSSRSRGRGLGLLRRRVPEFPCDSDLHQLGSGTALD